MKAKWLIVFLIGFVGMELSAQEPAKSEAQYEKSYKWRVRQEMLNGTYVPKDLTDAFIQLNKLIDKDSQKKFAAAPEDLAARNLHFSLGRWIITNWGFYGGSRLSQFMNEKLGIYHPDNMARFIIITYHRNLNKKPLEVKALIDQFEAQKEEEKQKRLEKGTVIHEETRKRDDGGSE